MADIDIEKKKKSSVWPWIVGILAALALIFLIWWLMDNRDGEAAAVVDPDTTEHRDTITRDTARDASGPVNTYLVWVQNMPHDDNEMGIHHEFTKNGLQNMANALASISERAENVNKQQFNTKLDSMRTMAASITNDPKSTQHANKIKSAFTAATNVMKELQETSFPNLQNDVKNVREEVDKIKTKEMTLEQKEHVKSVFRKSSDVIRKMDDNIRNKR